ncbi:heavy-metal-associated domain-containing protein, partial [Herminiimonas sp.]|uniref:heavy-metal-associated domain-containing protein n=1 Tax=Herminiimonas sp. TaxID=1926289 RepID=UPI00272258B8
MTTLQQAAPGTHRITLGVAGMTCASCASRVEKAINAIPGVRNTSVNLATDTVVVEAAAAVDAAAIRQAIEKAGYSVPQEDIVLDISGMTCASCAGRVEKALRKVDGVLDASINLATDSARIKVGSGTPASALIAAVEAAGYGAALPRTTGSTQDAARQTPSLDWLPVLFSALLALPLVVPMLLQPLGVHMMRPGWLQWALATPVQFWLGARF